MQKREIVGKGGGPTPPSAKRGRPFSAAGGGGGIQTAAPGDAMAPNSLLGPTLQVPISFADQNNKRIVLALQSGLKGELTWALNTLTLLSFKEKDDMRRDVVPLARIPGLLDAILQVIDDWRDIALPVGYMKPPRTRSLGGSGSVTGFGDRVESLLGEDAKKRHHSEFWYEEDGLFNLDDEGRGEKQQCAVAASNIIRNFSFMPENEMIMAQHRHCVETLFQCIEDQSSDEELVTNALETMVNLSPLLDLRIFSSSKPSFIKITEKRAVEATMGMLKSPIKAWHCASAELLGRLMINPDNEPFLFPFSQQIYKRLVDLLSFPTVDAQAAAVGALYNLAEVNVDCRLKLASERWAVERLVKVIKGPHPVAEVCRKAGMVLESLVTEPQNRPLLLAHENTFAEMLLGGDPRHSDTFARILYELTSRPTAVSASRPVWGMS